MFRANEEMNSVDENYKNEISSLKVELKRSFIVSQSLESKLKQKEVENDELTQICDELIANTK